MSTPSEGSGLFSPRNVRRSRERTLPPDETRPAPQFVVRLPCPHRGGGQPKIILHDRPVPAVKCAAPRSVLRGLSEGSELFLPPQVIESPRFQNPQPPQPVQPPLQALHAFRLVRHPLLLIV